MGFQFNILTLRGIGSFIIAFFELILAIMVWRKSKEKTVFWLGLTALFTAFYAFACGATYFFWDIVPEYRLFWYRTTWLGMLILPNLLIFIYYFVQKTKNIKIKTFFWYLVGGVISYLALTTPYMVESVYLRYPNISGVLGDWDIVGRLYIFLGIILGLFYLFKEYTKTDDKLKKLRIKYFIGGLSIYMVSLIIAGSVIPAITGENAYYDIVAYASAVWMVLTSYAILKHQLLDIRVVIKKTLIVSIIIAIISGLIMLVSLLSEWLASQVPGFHGWIVAVLAGCTAFIVGYLFWRKSKEVDRMKYEFVTVAAHKLRTPLTRVKWALDALPEQTKQATEEGKKLISNIEQANSQTIELAEELLNITKANAGTYSYQIVPAVLEKITKEVIEKSKDQIQKNNINLKFKAEKNLPQTKMDKKRISSVIQILLENAITYMAKGKGEIKINIEKERNYILFTIADNGIGIKPEDQQNIFSSFFRTHAAYLTDTEGTGIGLYLAKNIITHHKGKIGVKSEGENKGSAFWFKLPIR